MIKFHGERDGKPLYGFGLSSGNLRLLQQGKPILVDLAVMRGVGSVLIFWGETEADMIQQFQKAGIKLPPKTTWREQEPVQPGEFEQPEQKPKQLDP